MLKKYTAFFIFLLLSQGFSSSVLIYQNGGCGHCGPYVEELVAMLERNGYKDYVVKDFMSDTGARKEVYSIQEKFGVPLSMQGHMLVLIEDKYLFEGHVPVNMIEDYMRKPSGPVVVTQDSMGKASAYQMLVDGKVETYPIGQPIAQYNVYGRSGPGGIGNAALQITLLPLGLLALGGMGLLYSMQKK